MQRYVTEAIGTFFLVLTIACTRDPIAIGAMLMVMVYMGGHISGSHFNPAVTLAVFLRGKLPFKDVVPYWVFQFIGGFCGALIGWMLVRRTGTPAPVANDLWFHAMVAETLFAFALALVVLNVATCEKTEGNSYFGLAIGFTVAAGVSAVGRTPGGSAFNPAVGLGLHLTDLFNGNHSSKIQWFWISLIFPLIGGALAAFVYQFQHTGNFKAPGATELQEKYESNKNTNTKEGDTPTPQIDGSGDGTVGEPATGPTTNESDDSDKK